MLDKSFYIRCDVVQIAQDLLGKWLFTQTENGELTGGIISETEAYVGPWDRACHAFQNRHTGRTDVMFQAGGVAYVYLCYGIHHLLNVVTGCSGIPQAVLIRSIIPKQGIDLMLKRRNKSTLDSTLTSGPGALCAALNISLKQNGHCLSKSPLWIEDRGDIYSKKYIHDSKRIGIDYAKEHAMLPWRFVLIL